MGDEHKLYSKTEGSRDPIEIKKEMSVATIESSEIPIVDIPISYSKQDGTFSPALFIIISGGEEKERKYLAKISDVNNFPRISIEFISQKMQGLSTMQLLDKANEIKERLDQSIIEEFPDSIYLLSDRDHFYPEIQAIIPECKEKGYTLIVSNPCFEIWLYYSYFSNKPIDFISDDIKKTSSNFKTYLGTKVINGVAKGVNPVQAIFNIENAIINSEANYEEDENGIPKLFSTNMFVLGKQLVELIKPELEELKKQDKLRVEQYKNKLAD